MIYLESDFIQEYFNYLAQVWNSPYPKPHAPLKLPRATSGSQNLHIAC